MAVQGSVLERWRLGLMLLVAVVLGMGLMQSYTGSLVRSTVCPPAIPLPPRLVPAGFKEAEYPVVMQMDSFYVDYTPYFSDVSLFKNLRTNCGCRKYSLGDLDDGNKFLCDGLIQKDNCTVYSLGSFGEYSFEKAVHDALNCRIVTVDKDPYELPGYIDFRQHKLGTCTDCTTVDELLAESGDSDRMVDLFKTDIEGFEWELIDQIFSPQYKMVAIELHKMDRQRFESLFHLNDDWCIYNIEYNYRCGPKCLEVAFANRKYADKWH